MTTVRVRREALADIARLPSDALRRRCCELLYALEEDPRLGQPLAYLPMTGDLRGCRKLYFAEKQDMAPTHRIVYRLPADETEAAEVDVIAVGRRADYDAYRLAVERLGRL